MHHCFKILDPGEFYFSDTTLVKLYSDTDFEPQSRPAKLGNFNISDGIFYFVDNVGMFVF